MTTNITDTIVKLAAGSKPYIAASDAIIFGSTGADVVKIYDGVAVTTDTSIERVEFSRASSEYTYTATNTGVQVSYNGAIVANVANTQKLAFTDGSAVVATSVDATTSAVTFTLGGTTVTAAGSKFTPANLSKVAGETSTVTPSVPTPVPGSYTITPSATSVNEDSSVTFTVAGLTAETVAKTFNYQISGYSANSQVAVAANIDFTSVTGTVTIPAGAKTASFNLVPINDGVVEGFEGFKVTLLDSTSFNTVATSDAITISDVVLTGKVQPFTINTDNLTGTSGDDTFNANIGIVIDPTTGSASNVNTMQSVDSVSGGAGTADTVNFVFSGTGPVLGNTALVVLPSLSGVEVINGQSLGALKIDASTVSELTNLNITKAGAAGIVTATASATADISVAMKAVGAAVNLAGGKNVTVNLTDVSGTADIVSVGVATDADAAGDVSVNTTGAAYSTSTANTTLSGVNVTGGKTITVTNKAAASTSAAAADTSATTITQGGVNVIGNSSTTAVTIKQDATVAVENAANTTGGVTETASAKFSAMTSGETIILDNLGGSAGLTFTASGALTAAEAATAFANLVNNAAFAAPASIALGDTQGSGSAAKGIYTGIFAGWTSAAASGDTVVFTSTTANTNVADLTKTGTGTVAITTTQGKANDATPTLGVMGVTAGAVSVTDASATIKTITVDGYAASSTTTTSVLETLNLSNSADAMIVADSAATLALNLEKVGTSAGDAVVTITSAPTTLNVKSTGDNYVNLTAALTEILNVSGTGVLKVDATDLAVLKTVTVTGTAGLKLQATDSDTLTSIDTTGTTGAVTATIEGARSTYAGGAGVDTVTLWVNTALTKAINLGAGNDTLSFDTLLVTGSTAAVSGGDGTADTLSMTVAAADALDALKQTFYTGFERLTLNNQVDLGTADVTINLDNLGFTNYVTTSGTTDTSSAANNKLILDKLVSGGTLALTGTMLSNSAGIQVNVTDAATGTADVLNVIVDNVTGIGGVNAGTLTAANVETVNITVADKDNTGPDSHSLTLTADKATSVVVTNADVGDKTNFTLYLNGSTKVTSVDGSAMQGGLTVTSVNTTTATTLKGGTGSDVLTAATGNTADVLRGGAGNDVLVSNAGLDMLTGDEGADVFRIATASLNVNTYATITDFTAGDLIQIPGISTFVSAKVTMGETAVFQDFANAAITALTTGKSGWFQFNNNTYIVADLGAESLSAFDSTDSIVKLTGLVDLTNASFNDTSDTIAL